MSDKQPTAGEQSTMGLYLRELRRIPPLSREEEQAFAALAAQGDRKARQHLVQANLRFVILVAKRYRNRGVPLEDLVNEGNIGLMRRNSSTPTGASDSCRTQSGGSARRS